MAKFVGIAGLMMMMMVVLMMGSGSEGAAYTVGESSGWSMGADYDTWAKDKTFAVGDTLVFNYPSGHNVEEVSAADYKSCTSGNAITSDSSGATSITIKTAGPHYYICGIPGHCDGGMKVAVTAAASGTGAAPGGSDDASPSGSTAGSPPATTTAGSPPAKTTTASPATPTGVNGVTRTQPSSSAAAMSPSVACLFAVFFAALKRFVM